MWFLHRGINYMLVALFRQPTTGRKHKKRNATAIKLMLCLTQEMGSSSSFPLCTRVDTAHAGLDYAGDSHDTPLALLPLKLKLVPSNNRVQRYTATFISIRRSFGRMCVCEGVVIWNSLDCFRELPHQNFIVQMHAIGGHFFGVVCVAVFAIVVAVFLHSVID